MGIMSLPWSLVLALTIAVVSAGDEVALLAFREQISDGGALASWNSSAGFCSWEGVTCGRWMPKRAVALRLDGRALVGALSPALGNLTFLRTLNLSFNWFHGEIPASLGRLHRLRRLDLSDNSFSSTFPVNLSSCVSMTEMRLRNNKLGGRIPTELGDKLASLEDALPDRTLEIADPTIWLHGEPKDDITSSRIQECLLSVFRLGISCSKAQPRERTLIRNAAAEMHAIRDAYLLFAGKRIGEHGAKGEPRLKTFELE
uniref:Leucine-rich repeat-containing N-terminal plant-type domain-containing protein n=1 Tax=Triticum aestivum TaxID=4565 RepID=A0A077RVW1_WHEAT|nr:unnamed protein product [Triticum aestivum]